MGRGVLGIGLVGLLATAGIVAASHAGATLFASSAGAQPAAVAAAVDAALASTSALQQATSSPFVASTTTAVPQATVVYRDLTAPDQPAPAPSADTAVLTQAEIASLALKIQGLSDGLAAFQSNVARELTLAQSAIGAPGPAASGGILNTIAATNRIDQLTGTHISNALLTDATVDGLSGLTESDIPDLSSKYLSVSGGSLSGLARFTNASTSLLSVLGPAYFGTTATSTFGADGALTLAVPLGVSSGGTGANAFGAGWLYSSGGTAALTASTSPTVGSLTATSTATSTFAGPLSVLGATSLASSLSVASNSYFARNVGIGTTNPSNPLEVVGQSGTTTSAVTTYVNGGQASQLALRTAQGTQSSPSLIGTSGEAGEIDFQGYDGSARGFVTGSLIYSKQKIVQINNTYYGDLHFATRNTNNGLLTDDLVLSSGAATLYDTLTAVKAVALHINDSDTDLNGMTAAMQVENTSNKTGNYSGIQFQSQTGKALAFVGAQHTTNSLDTEGDLVFAVASSSNNSSLTEYMRIKENGNVGIGTIAPYSRLTIFGADTSGATAALTIANSASTTAFQVFDDGNAALAGSLTQNSDERLKQDIATLDASTSLAELLALDPVTYQWRDPSRGTSPQLGFIAQQVQGVLPSLVSTTSATALTPGGTLGVNYIGFIPVIVSAMQTLAREVASFAEEITTHLLSADTVRTNELCVGSTCITQQQFEQMVEQVAHQPAAVVPPVFDDNAATITLNLDRDASMDATTTATSSTPAQRGDGTADAGSSATTTPLNDNVPASDATTTATSTAA